MTKSYIELVSKFEGHKWDLVKQRVLIAVPMDVDYEKIVETVRLKNFRAAVNRVKKLDKSKTLALKDTTENRLI